MSKLILVTFADRRFSNSLKRIEVQTRRFPFNERYFLNEDTCLTKEYWKRLKPWLYRRGFGYWSWKFSIVKEYLEKINENDLLFYSDAGITWNSSEKALELFREHITSLSEDNDILVFSQQTITKDWTKGDILQEMDVYDDDNICNGKQLYAGFFCIKKTPQNMEIIDKLVSLSDIRRELITDKRSIYPNKKGFIENRHDQSIFSVLIRQYPRVEVAYSERYELDIDGNEILDSPIQVIRQKELERSTKSVFINKVLRPWREILHIYFKYIRHYDYIGRYSW